MTAALRTTSVVDALHDELKARILRGDEQPGSALTELNVSAAFGVARPTAKAAIERLIAGGLLVRASRRAGPTVPELTQDEIEDLYDTRIAIETHAHELLGAAGIDIDSAEAQNTALRAAADGGDALGVVDADVAFHRELVRLTGSTRTARAHELLLAEAQLCMARVQANQLLTAATIAGEHDAIVTAIRSGDRDAIVEATAHHLSNAEHKLLGHLFG